MTFTRISSLLTAAFFAFSATAVSGCAAAEDEDETTEDSSLEEGDGDSDEAIGTTEQATTAEDLKDLVGTWEAMPGRKGLGISRLAIKKVLYTDGKYRFPVSLTAKRTSGEVYKYFKSKPYGGPDDNALLKGSKRDNVIGLKAYVGNDEYPYVYPSAERKLSAAFRFSRKDCSSSARDAVCLKLELCGTTSNRCQTLEYTGG